MPRALITGITGQDGGYLAERLVQDGWEVHGLVQPGDGAPVPAGVVPHPADLADPEAVAAVVARSAPAEIYHLGGVSSVARSWDEPVPTALTNALGTAALLDAAWRLGDARVLLAGSAEIFGRPEQVPQDETTPVRPVSPYGAAKAYAHHLGQLYRDRGLPVAGCILYNHESPRRPETFVTRKIARAVAAIAAGSPQKLVLGNLDARRDWGWAPDYVDAMVRAQRHDPADDYVIATGVAHSVRDFVAAAFAVVGIEDWERHVQIDPAFKRPVDPAEQVGDAQKARTVLGWVPKIGFEELVGLMVKAELR